MLQNIPIVRLTYQSTKKKEADEKKEKIKPGAAPWSGQNGVTVSTGGGFEEE